MPRANNQADSETDFKVILRNAQGKFLAEDDNGFYFTTERRAAKVLNYLADHVAEQLHDLRQATKIELIPEPVPLEEVYELCDRCGELFLPTMVLFDGKRFLCRECAELACRPRNMSGHTTREAD
jgi:formylmethanofuran dehydrogenase subunit E